MEGCPICEMIAKAEAEGKVAGGGGRPGSGAASLDVLGAFSGVWTDPARAKDFLAAVREHMAHSGSEQQG